MDGQEVIERHQASGRPFSAAGIDSFVLEAGSGDPVVCLHGGPASAFLYRKLVPELARRGLSGVAFDLPGLGLAERPVDFDYTWTGLGRWVVAAVQALELDRFHLVVHDLGGPVGLELAAQMPERVASLTLLNTLVEVDTFRRPWVMMPFAVPGVGLAALKLARHGEAVRRAADVPDIIRLPGKHFLQEDQAPALADHIARFVQSAAEAPRR